MAGSGVASSAVKDHNSQFMFCKNLNSVVIIYRKMSLKIVGL